MVAPSPYRCHCTGSETKEVYSSLFIGIILGAVEYCISMGTGLDGFLVHLTNHTVIEGDETKDTD